MYLILLKFYLFWSLKIWETANHSKTCKATRRVKMSSTCLKLSILFLLLLIYCKGTQAVFVFGSPSYPLTDMDEEGNVLTCPHRAYIRKHSDPDGSTPQHAVLKSWEGRPNDDYDINSVLQGSTHYFVDKDGYCTEMDWRDLYHVTWQHFNESHNLYSALHQGSHCFCQHRRLTGHREDCWCINDRGHLERVQYDRQRIIDF